MLPAAQVQGSGRKNWMGPSTVVNGRWLHRQNRNAVKNPVLGLPGNPCTVRESAPVSRQPRDWNFQRVSILTVQPPAVDHGRGPRPFFYARCPEPVLLVALRITGLQYSYFESILRTKCQEHLKNAFRGADGALGTPSYRAKTPRPAEHP